MALPLTAIPIILAQDDVLPAEAVQRAVDYTDDLTSFAAAQHYEVGRNVGQHDMPQIPIAVAMVEVGSLLELTNAGHALRHSAFIRDWGYSFSDAGAGAPSHSFWFQLPERCEIFGAHATVRYSDAVPTTAMASIAPLVVFDQTADKVVVRLGTDAAYNVESFMLLVYGNRRP